VSVRRQLVLVCALALIEGAPILVGRYQPPVAPAKISSRTNPGQALCADSSEETTQNRLRPWRFASYIAASARSMKSVALLSL
jgi:hypothetical protein